MDSKDSQAIQTTFSRIFEYSESKIRVCGTADEPWFCGKDIATILGYSKPTDAVNDNVDADNKSPLSDIENKVTGSTGYPKTTNKNELKAIYINEPGLYALILRSKLPAAKGFTKWVTSEVLPSIRKTGQYKITQQIEEIKTQLQIESREAIETAEKATAVAESKLAEVTAKLAIAEAAKLRVKSLVRSTQTHTKSENVYIVTTEHYARNNLFKVGHTKNIKGRLSTYNTGRPEGDNVYVAWKFSCHSARILESRIKFWLGDFLETKEKEMYIINFAYLKNIVEEIATHFDIETNTRNNYILEQLELATEAEPIIPPRFIEIKSLPPDLPSKFTFDESKLNDPAERNRILDYIMRTYFNLTKKTLTLTWADIAKYLKTEIGDQNSQPYKQGWHASVKSYCNEVGIHYKLR